MAQERVPTVHRAAERAVALVRESDRATAELSIACVSAGIDLAGYDEIMAATVELWSERGELASELTKFATGVVDLLRALDASDALGDTEFTDEIAEEFVAEFARLGGELSPQGSSPRPE